jgi:primosomal protein N' (replication factor Y)
MPEHYVLRLAADQNYEDFYQEEIALRRALVFPPICDICVLGFVSTSEESAAAAAQYAAQCVTEIIRQTGFSKPLRVLGPMPFAYGKIGGKYRYRMILKCKNTAEYRELIREILKAVYGRREFSKVHVYADMNGDIGI